MQSLYLTVGNGAGLIKLMEDFEMFLHSGVTRAMVGTITIRENSGNHGDIFHLDPENRLAVNSMNLPNPGREYYYDMGKLYRMVQKAHDAGIELWLSVWGDTPQEFVELVDMGFRCGVDGVQLDWGCPNRFNGGTNLLPICFDLKACQEILDYLDTNFDFGWGERKRISVKLSPMPWETAKHLVKIINQSGVVSEVVAFNTERAEMMLKRDGTPALSYYVDGSTTQMHSGGVSGAPLKAKLLELIPLLRKELFARTDLVVSGGVFCGQDIDDCMQAAKTKENPFGSIQGVEATTGYYLEGIGFYWKLRAEYLEILERKASQEKTQFDADYSPFNPHNRQAALDHGLVFDDRAKVYRDTDGAMVRDKFGQPL